MKYVGTDNLEAVAGAVNYNTFLINEICRACKPTDTLVDFGAGIGTHSLALKEAGYSIVCIEPDSALRQRLVHNGLKSFSSLDELPEESIDFIFTLNVLEHLPNDQEYIRKMFSKLPVNGKLFIYVPAFTILYSSMDKKVGHMRRYRRKGLVRQLKTAGFKIEQAAYVDSLGYVAALLYKAIGSDKGDLNLQQVRMYDRYCFPISRRLDQCFKYVLGKNLQITAVKP